MDSLALSGSDATILADNALDAGALRAIARTLRRQAQRFDRLAERKERDERRHADALTMIDAAWDTGGMVEGLVKSGADLADAIAEIARQSSLPMPTIEAHWWRLEKVREKQRRAKRDLEIIRLAGRGWTDARIAVKYELNPSTINRIVQRQYRGAA